MLTEACRPLSQSFSLAGLTLISLANAAAWRAASVYPAASRARRMFWPIVLTAARIPVGADTFKRVNA